ncbi:MAG: ComEC family competence protein [Chitinophagaceae bacterium]|nr:ComEC family competence protein [Chitinophagaceae bacterium]
MRSYGPNFRRSHPFIRLLVALVVGILVQRYIDLPLALIAIILLIAIAGWLFIRFATIQHKFRWRWIGGISIFLCLFAAGAVLVYTKDIRHRSAWIGYQLNANLLLVTVNEPLTAKARSFKTTALVKAVYVNRKWEPVTGTLLVYFARPSVSGRLHSDTFPLVQYGSRLVIRKPLQQILGPGNPGAFDYGKYCAAQNIYHQVYLQPKDYLLLPGPDANNFTAGLLNVRDRVLSTLRQFIPGEKEAGVAEALLIGYRNDLDKELVQAYSNTGVVHIIAISGLHLGMIYGLLVALFKPFRRFRGSKLVKPVFILAVLWGFSLLTGAAASILRSAVMFSFIVIGESLGRKTRIYNTLAASAFCLLVYDPGMLWDVGFQLSYAAVLSIIIFMKPIYRQIYCRNKILNMVWELNSITLAAQILTLPLLLFYFHQFPNLFLFTNFIAVPLSGFILYGELILLLVTQIPFINNLAGMCSAFLIRQMDGVIERTDRLPFGATVNIPFILSQAILLYAGISLLAWWIFQKNKPALLGGCFIILLLIATHSVTTIQQKRQRLLLVYNIPKQSAMDIIEGKQYNFYGDTGLLRNRSLQNFHLQPARILYGVAGRCSAASVPPSRPLRTGHTTILLVDPAFHLPRTRLHADLVVFSHRPRLSVPQLAAVIDCPQYVFDSSNPLWKIREWKKQADSLHLRHHSVPEQGAFQMAL